MFAAPRGLMAPTLKQLDLSYNPDLGGPLPPAGATFTDLQEIVRSTPMKRAAVIGGRRCIFLLPLVVPPLTPFVFLFFVYCFFSSIFLFSFPAPPRSSSQNLAGTGVSSGLPSTWGAFSALQHLTLSDTQLQCPLTVDTEGEVSGRGRANGGGGRGSGSDRGGLTQRQRRRWSWAEEAAGAGRHGADSGSGISSGSGRTHAARSFARSSPRRDIGRDRALRAARAFALAHLLVLSGWAVLLLGLVFFPP